MGVRTKRVGDYMYFDISGMTVEQFDKAINCSLFERAEYMRNKNGEVVYLKVKCWKKKHR